MYLYMIQLLHIYIHNTNITDMKICVTHMYVHTHVYICADLYAKTGIYVCIH